MAVQCGDMWFVHIPKNGGVSVTKWLINNIGLNEPFVGHYDHCGAQSLPQGSKYFVTCRNPYTRLISQYKFAFHNTRPRPLFEDEYVGGLYGSSFQQWIKSLSVAQNHLDELLLIPEHERTPYQQQVISDALMWRMRQVDHIDVNNPPVYVLRFEYLESDFKQIQKHYANYQPLHEYNQGMYNKHGVDLNHYYDENIAQIVNKFYRRDFEYFNYDQELPS